MVTCKQLPRKSNYWGKAPSFTTERLGAEKPLLYYIQANKPGTDLSLLVPNLKTGQL